MGLKDEARRVKLQAQYIFKLGKIYATTKVIKTEVTGLKIVYHDEVICDRGFFKTHFNKYKDVVTIYFKTGVKVPLTYTLLRKGNSLKDIQSLTNRLGSKLRVVMNLDLHDPAEVVDYRLFFKNNDEPYEYTESGANLIFYKDQLVEGELSFHIDDYREVISLQR